LFGEKIGNNTDAYTSTCRHWKNPDTFSPDRWLKPVEGQKGEFARVRRPDEYVLPVFWGGARLCLGKDMARFEVILIASMLLKRLKFKIKPHGMVFL